METLYLLSNTKLNRCNNTIKITTTSGIKKSFPVETLKHIIVIGSATFNSELSSFLGKNNIRVSFLDYYGNFSSSIEPCNRTQSGAVHLAQAKWILDDNKRLLVAKKIISVALHNIINNLKYYLYRGYKKLEPNIKKMLNYKTDLVKATSIEQMMGYEGQSRQTYYASWRIINPKLTIEKRTKRPPTDQINALLSFLNSLTYSLCKNELSKTHLDTSLSFIHAPTQSRASLSLDIAEIFKPILADKIIFRLYNKDIIHNSDFDQHENACLLNEKGRRKIIELFRKKTDQEKIHEFTGYRSLILKECYQLEAYLLELSEYKPYIQRI